MRRNLVPPPARNSPATDRSLRLSVLERPEDLDGLGSAWDQLAERSSQSPFALRGYVVESWRSSGMPGWCITAHRGAELVGALALGAQARLGGRAGHLLTGAHRANLLCDPADAERVGRALLAAAGDLPIAWLPVRGVMPGNLLDRALQPGTLVDQEAHVLRMEMPDGWEAAYREQSSAKSRNTDRRKLRRLGELGEVRFDLATSGESLWRGLDEAFEIYRRRWAGRAGEAGGFGINPAGWHAVAQRLGAEGNVQLVTLRLGGVAVAFSYAFLFDQTMWTHRLAFDPALDRYSPGWLTVLHAIETASEAGARRVDFGIGQEAYKARLATSSTQLKWGVAVASGLRGSVLAQIDQDRVSARQYAKHISLVRDGRQRLVDVQTRFAPRAASAISR